MPGIHFIRHGGTSTGDYLSNVTTPTMPGTRYWVRSIESAWGTASLTTDIIVYADPGIEVRITVPDPIDWISEPGTSTMIQVRSMSREPMFRDVRDEALREITQLNEDRMRAFEQDRKDAAQKRADAEVRSRELLKTMLDDEQQKQLEKDNTFFVVAKSGTRYQITIGRIANINVLDKNGRTVRRLCVHPENQSLPVFDVMLAQLLHLKNDEAGLLQIANVHPGDGRVRMSDEPVLVEPIEPVLVELTQAEVGEMVNAIGALYPPYPPELAAAAE